MRDLTSKHIHTVCNPDFDKALVIFVQKAELRGMILTGDFYNQLDIPKNECQKLSNGWLESFEDHVELYSLYFYGLATIPRHGTKQLKVRLTLAFITNADGTECLPPLIIGYAKCPHCFQKKTGEQLGFQYYSNTYA
ncbi:hypothetical protein G9A89_015289 [Geosiphon pyriformis]|nr:hypothetical protein G9A89_015289 [Geosiphon pyriformis]